MSTAQNANSSSTPGSTAATPQAPDLLSPVRLGALDLANRVFMAPLTRSRASADGVPQPLAAEYYAQRATAGMIITAATQVSFEGMGYARTPGIHTPEQIDGWRRVLDAVHAKGGKIAVQLWHVGRIAHHANRPVPADIVAPSAITAPGQIFTDALGMVDHDQPRALETREIAAITDSFARAAETAVRIGFDGVEVHSANGYLLHQFLSSNVNQRTDQYGGSIDNRVRMPLEVIKAVAAAAGPNKVGVRVSPGHTFNGIEETDMAALYGHYLPALDALGLAYLHVMRPTSNTAVVDPVTMARALYKGRILAAGNYSVDDGRALIASGGADAVAFGRAYIANPDLVERIRQSAALNEPDAATFYTPGAKGYTDYPRLAA
ncbi:MAG: alkene reductase [Hyphomicrobium sp.]